jgi:Ca2+-binding RTX toxin-like protein
VALGDGSVDIGLFGFDASSGIEIIDGSGAAGTVRLLGNWESNTLDFSAVQLLGANILIDGADGNDTITGSQGNDTISGGSGDDRLNGGQGADDYIVTGNEAEGWSSFQGYDTYNDRGTSGNDRILAVGLGNVDIGLRNFAPTNGIEIIDGSGAIGTVRLLGNWEANNLNFSAVSMNGVNLRIDGAGGNDTLTGSQGKDIIVGGDGADKLIGGLSADQLTGGKGKDQFTFLSVADIGLPLSGQDTITDFISGQDLVDLMSIDANTLIAGNQAFAYIGSAAFGGQAGQLRFSSGLLAGDTNGDQVSDFELLLTNVTILKTTDIRL